MYRKTISKSKHSIILILFGLLSLSVTVNGQDKLFTGYHTPDQIRQSVSVLQKAHPDLIRIHTLATTFTGQEVYLVEVGDKKEKPAVMVAANMEGTTPLASEAALYLLNDLIAKPDEYKDLTWYILPCGNPEAAKRLFGSPLYKDGRNQRPFNDDMDEAIDEDGYEDLNGDGWITQMRVKDPEGTMVADEKDPRILRRAKTDKGEKGTYKLYTEGIDNDGDGQYNEDGPGGTNIGITFPHLYPYNQRDAGLWSGSEPEVYALMKFINDRPQIAFSMTYGNTNFCLVPPKSGRKGSANLSSIKLSGRNARMLNADPSKTYSLEEVKELLKAVVPPGTNVDDSMVASLVDGGPAVNPLPNDLKWYTEYSKKFKEFQKEKKYSYKRNGPGKDKGGSFELWAYYHLGLPSFSMDFWATPLIEAKEDKKDAGKGTDSKAGGESKGGQRGSSAASSSKAPQENKAMTDFLTYSDSLLGGKGFIPWTTFQHPQLGEVEIGGKVPFADAIPATWQADSLFPAQVPWIYQLVKDIPRLKIEDQKVSDRGAGVYEVEIWIRNVAKLPFPTAMGKRNKKPVPAVLTVSGQGLEFLSGRPSQPVTGLDGFANKKLSWLVHMEKPGDLTFTLKASNAFGDSKTINLGGK